MIIKSHTVERILQSVAGSADITSFRDVRIRCSEGRSESVFCHRTILSSFSPFLSSLLASSCPCKADVSIILDSTNIETVQALMGILYTGTLRVSGEKSKAEVLSLAEMLGMDLNNFCVEEVNTPSLSYPFPFTGLKPVALNHLHKKSEAVAQSEDPPKKKRGRPRKVRPEGETEKEKKGKKARKSEKIERDEDSSPDIFYHVTNPTFKVKAAEKKTVKKKGRKRKIIEEVEGSASAEDIPQISLTFDLGEERDKTINLHQLTGESRDVKRHRKESEGARPSENFLTFASPEEALESIEAEEEALNYSSDDEKALIMDLSLSGGAV